MAVYDGIGSMVLIVTDHVNAGEAGAAISDGRGRPKEHTFEPTVELYLWLFRFIHLHKTPPPETRRPANNPFSFLIGDFPREKEHTLI